MKVTTEACTHRKVTAYSFVDGNQSAGLWACADCGHKFVPLDLRKELDADRYRWLRMNAGSVGFSGFMWIWDQKRAKKRLDRAIDEAMAATPAGGAA